MMNRNVNKVAYPLRRKYLTCVLIKLHTQNCIGRKTELIKLRIKMSYSNSIRKRSKLETNRQLQNFKSVRKIKLFYFSKERKNLRYAAKFRIEVDFSLNSG